MSVANTSTGVRISGNSIHDNGGIGIDLITDGFVTGVTPNDPLDVDTGGNGLQNFPVLQSAAIAGATLHVVGTLNSNPSTGFTIEFFASPQCDPSGYGEGGLFLGATTVTTNGSGNAAFNVVLPTAVPAGWFATATATAAASGSTSEFSACIATSNETCQADLGFGGPGSSTLTLCGGDLSTGTSADLVLANAAPNSLALFAVGDTFQPIPLFGGTVVPIPLAVVIGVPTDALGMAVIGGVPGGGGPTTLYLQAAYLDAALPQSIGFSNALSVAFLP